MEVLPKEMIFDNKFIIIDIKKKERLFKLLDIYTF